MIILDTNVLSGLLWPRPDKQVGRWLAGHDGAKVYFTTVGEAELRHGVAILPPGKRRDALTTAIEGLLDEVFRDRVLPFDRAAARAYATIASARSASGRPISQFDCQWSSNNPQLWSSNFPHPSTPRSERWKWKFDRPSSRLRVALDRALGPCPARRLPCPCPRRTRRHQCLVNNNGRRFTSGEHEATVAARTTSDYEGCGIELSDPWTFSARQ